MISASRCSSATIGSALSPKELRRAAALLLLFFLFPLHRRAIGKLQDLLREPIRLLVDWIVHVVADLAGCRGSELVLEAAAGEQPVERRLQGRQILRLDRERG